MRRIVILSVLAAAGCAGSRRASVGGPTATRSADVAEIRATRAASNAALARRDAAGFVASMLPSYHVLPAGTLVQLSRDSTHASLARQFADTAMLGYVRTPITIDVSATGPTAAEHGRWVGRRRRTDGIQETAGTYYAAWRRTSEGWRLHAETFVALSCVGSAQCPGAR
jgi:ketosteroid isomerase-like protein